MVVALIWSAWVVPLHRAWGIIVPIVMYVVSYGYLGQRFSDGLFENDVLATDPSHSIGLAGRTGEK
jgi:hypothetical protein